MRNPVENITTLQKQLNELQLENQMLKNLLDRAGIPYAQAIKALKEPEQAAAYDPDQGARIIHPKQITDAMANQFYARFWGRQDVYAKRNEKKKTGEAGYFTQCHNFWQEVCPKTHGQKMNCTVCPQQKYKKLTKTDILNHLRGVSYNASDVIGVYPLLANDTCRFWVYDFDNHEKDAKKHDFANTDDAWMEEVEAMRTICRLNRSGKRSRTTSPTISKQRKEILHDRSRNKTPHSISCGPGSYQSRASENRFCGKPKARRTRYLF